MLNIPQEKLTAIKIFAHQYIFKLLCQQDIPFILAHLDPQLIGIGAAEHNYYDTPQAAKDFILSLEGQIPACELLNEEWTILPLAQGLYTCPRASLSYLRRGSAVARSDTSAGNDRHTRSGQ